MMMFDQSACLREFHDGKGNENQSETDTICLPRENHQTERDADGRKKNKADENERQKRRAVQLFVCEHTNPEERMLRTHIECLNNL